MINTRRELQYSHIPRLTKPPEESYFPLIILFLLPDDAGNVGAVVCAVLGAVAVLAVILIGLSVLAVCVWKYRNQSREGEVYL